MSNTTAQETTNQPIDDFPMIPASKMSIAKRGLICGHGINDAPYILYPKINGKQTVCRFYREWEGMLKRVYSAKYHAKYPSYISTSVHPPWLYFMTFRAWMIEQDWQGKQLDKDILIPGNKHYSPSTCLFVSGQINTLLNDSGAARGDYPRGVYWNKARSKFVAKISKYGKKQYIGDYPTQEEASAAYIKAKSKHVFEIAMQQEDERIKNGLMLHVLALQGALGEVA